MTNPKSHGPSFHKILAPTLPCPGCHGRGFVMGISFELECNQCWGAGVVLEETGDAIPEPDRVMYLRLMLTASEQDRNRQAKLIESLEPYRKAKAAADLAESMYPSKYKHVRRGGYGD